MIAIWGGKINFILWNNVSGPQKHTRKWNSVLQVLGSGLRNSEWRKPQKRNCMLQRYWPWPSSKILQRKPLWWQISKQLCAVEVSHTSLLTREWAISWAGKSTVKTVVVQLCKIIKHLLLSWDYESGWCLGNRGIWGLGDNEVVVGKSVGCILSLHPLNTNGHICPCCKPWLIKEDMQDSQETFFFDCLILKRG